MACLGQAIFDRKARNGQAFARAFCMLLASFWQASGGPSASSCPAISEHSAHAVSAFAQPFAGSGQGLAQQVTSVLQASGMQFLRTFGWLGQASCERTACIGHAFRKPLANICFCILCVLRASLARDRESAKKLVHFSICACHPCAGAMLIFSVSFQF